jgi:hypothetical protein
VRLGQPSDLADMIAPQFWTPEFEASIMAEMDELGDVEGLEEEPLSADDFEDEDTYDDDVDLESNAAGASHN